MPPPKKYSREDIVDAAMHIVEHEGIEVLNARRVAQELGCSTQPIYNSFASMDSLRDAVIQKMGDIYVSYMLAGGQEERAYLGMGLAYIRFARDYPNFFKVLFMSHSGLSPTDYIGHDDAANDVIRAGANFTGFSEREQTEFHLKIWVFTHGIAALVCAGTVDFTDEQITDLLVSATHEMLLGYKQLNHKEEK